MSNVEMCKLPGYPPVGSQTIRAQDFERSPPPSHNHEAGPSKRPSVSNNRLSHHHSNRSSSHLLFSAKPPPPLISRQSSRSHRAFIPLSPEAETLPRPHQSLFLNEDQDPFFSGADTEGVHVPDFGHMLGFDPGSGDDHFAVAQGMKTRWKRKLYLLMEEPSSGREAFFVHILVTGGILFSAVLTTLSTLPSFHTDPVSSRALFGLDTTIVVLFTVEYITRTLAHSDSLKQYYNWSTSFFSLLDLLAILPYYIEVARNDDTSILFRFSILRTFRLLRVFRAFRYQNQMLLTIEVMYVAVQRSKDALVALSFFLLLVLVFFSTLIYFAERGTWDANLGGFVDADGDPSQFDSIPQTAWFALVTMSTVGYGDVVPRSSLGKVLTVPLLMFGLLLIALPSFVLGRNFAIVFDVMTKQAQKAPTVTSSPRASFSQPPSPVLTARPTPQLPIIETSPSTPLLPTSNSGNIISYPINPNKRPVSPLPGGAAMVASGSASSRVVSGMPRMWDGGMGEPHTDKAKEKDLTNTKLAKNQLVLLEQIDSLRKTVDKQSEMMNRLMAALDVRKTSNGHPPEIAVRRGKGKDEEEEQFALGEDEEDYE